MKCSLIVTNYNYGKFAERCIRSCLNQDFDKNKYEIIFVDDKSSDGSEKIIKKFCKFKNFTFIKNKKNLGVAGSSNVGINNSKGEYVVRVDSDDYISKDLIKFLSTYLDKDNSILGVACDYYYFNEKNSKKIRISAREFPISCGIMYRRELLSSYGKYNQAFRHREEEELRQRLGNLYKIGYLEIPLYRYRMHEKNKTKQKKQMSKFKVKLTTPKDIIYPINYEPFKRSKDIKKFKKYKKIIAVIPARGNSKRLKDKNIFKLWNKPMIYWTIKAAKKSKFIKEIYVSSESKKILSIAKNFKVKTIERPEILSNDKVFKMDVVAHATKYVERKFEKPEIIVSIQANSPEIRSSDIDGAINHMIKYERNEVISVDKNGNQNAAIRVMLYDTVFQRTLSTRVGFYKTNITDIHTIEDIKNIKNK